MNIKIAAAAMIALSIAAGVAFVAEADSAPSGRRIHTAEEIARYRGIPQREPLQPGEYFLPSTSCRGCHGYDSAQLANINEAGEDINLVDRWESSMMALSAKDPLWRAKVSHEILVNPGHSLELQNKCTSCHAPMGHYTSKFKGNPHYLLSNLYTDTLGQDGVSCGSCHMISPNTGFTFSGDIQYDTSKVEYGPFPSPFVGPMQLYENLTPVYSPHISQSKVCASCHTLVTETADLAGNPTGGHFAEQATYHEYLNSDFPANGITCQTCHMPKLTDPIIIANGASGLTPRFPFNQHSFAGANLFMLKLIKANRDSLGINVPYRSFDSTIVATEDMLMRKSLNVDLALDSSTTDTAYFTVTLENKAGHKFPSGYPARRAVLQFVVTTPANDTVFRSGMFQPDYSVVGETPAWEPHHNFIRQENRPQIYEIAMGDVNGNFTSVLERAAILLKDNRIPPAGFTTTHPSYDTMAISSDAIADPDFNKVSSAEGSGIDKVHFCVPITGKGGNFTVRTKVYYQSVPPKWVNEMFSYNSGEIDKFRTMYQSADHTPALVGADSMLNVLTSTGRPGLDAEWLRVWPTISSDGRVTVDAGYGRLIRSVEVLDMGGRKLSVHANTGFAQQLEINLPSTSGAYYLKIYVDGKFFYKKVVRS